MGNVIITGASGFIGSHIVEYFCRHGMNPGCLVRKSSNTEFLRELNVDLIFGDIKNYDEIHEAFKDAEFIIHTSAKVSDWGRYEDFFATNVQGTINIVKAAIANNIKYLIITGSNSCYGEESSSEVKDENSPYKSHYYYFLDKLFPSCLNYYRDTKALANIEAMKLAEKHSLNLTVIEPVWVYGEREFHSGFYDFLKTIESGLPCFPGSKKNKFHTIYARDLAKLYFLTYTKRLTGINKFIACSRHAEYQTKILELFCHAVGLKMPYKIPKTVIYFPAFIAEMLYTIFRAQQSPVISRAKVNIFYDNIEYSSEKARNFFGFVSDYTLEESIKNTVEWYRKNKLLK